MIMLRNRAAYKYETPFKVMYEITEAQTNGSIILKMVEDNFR